MCAVSQSIHEGIGRGQRLVAERGLVEQLGFGLVLFRFGWLASSATAEKCGLVGRQRAVGIVGALAKTRADASLFFFRPLFICIFWF